MSETSFAKKLFKLETKYSAKDIDWVKYVRDHYETILRSCSVQELDVEEHYWENYRLEDYLKRIGFDPNAAWIVLYVNQIPSNLEFKELKEILLPNLSILDDLYTSFMQIRSNVKACRNI